MSRGIGVRARSAGTLPGRARDGAEGGWELVEAPRSRSRGARVSSARIRELIEAGRLAQARTLLGRPYRVVGEVVHGDGRGRTSASRRRTSISTRRCACRPTASMPPGRPGAARRSSTRPSVPMRSSRSGRARPSGGRAAPRGPPAGPRRRPVRRSDERRARPPPPRPAPLRERRRAHRADGPRRRARADGPCRLRVGSNACAMLRRLRNRQTWMAGGPVAAHAGDEGTRRHGIRHQGG